MRIHLARGAKIHSFAQLFDHREYRLGGLIEQLNLLTKTQLWEVLRENEHSLANFLHRLRDFVERRRQRLNVFTLEWSNKRLGQLLGEFLGDPFVFAPALSK